MKLNRGLKFAFMLGYGMLAGATLHAQSFPITTKLTLQRQDFSTFNGTVYNDKVQNLKLSSDDLLHWLADAYQTNFPTGFPWGSKLMLVNYDHFQVQAGDGTILVEDTSNFLTYSDTYVENNFLYQGKENIVNGSLNYFYFYRSTIQFNDGSTNGRSFTFSGNTQERYSRSPQDLNGNRLYQGSLTIDGNGSGTHGTNFFLLSGRFNTPVVQWRN